MLYITVRLLRVLWTARRFNPVHPKGDQSGVFIGRTDAGTPILWPPDVKSWLIWKDPDAGKHWRREEKGTREDEMVGWHHRLDGWRGRPGMLWSMGSRRVGHDWAPELMLCIILVHVLLKQALLHITLMSISRFMFFANDLLPAVYFIF